MLKKIRTGIQLFKIWNILKQINMEKLKVYLAHNWKTTVAAIVIGVALPTLVNAGVITASEAGTITTVATALGFAVAKDANVTGNGK